MGIARKIDFFVLDYNLLLKFLKELETSDYGPDNKRE